MLRYALLYWVAFISAAMCSAQQLMVSPKPSWVIEPQYSVQIQDTTNSGGYYYLLYSQQYNAETKEVYTQAAIRVLNQNGLSSASSFNETYDPSYQSFRMHTLYLLRGGKKIDRLEPGSFEIMRRETNLSRQTYDGSYSVINNIAGLEVGDIVVYSFTTAGSNKVFGNHFFQTLRFEFGVPIGKLHYVVTSASSRKLYLKEHGKQPERRESLNNDRRTYTWEATNVAAIIQDDGVPEWFSPYGEIEITDFASWAELSDWANGLFRIDLRKSAALGRFVDSLKTITDKDKQVVAAIQAVQDKIRYLSLSNGISGYQPHRPAEVFEKRYGDCKDKSVLLAEILKALDVPAQPVLVHSSEGLTLNERLPSPWDFNHCIIKFAYKDSTYWVDPTMTLQRGSLKKLYIPAYHYGLVVGDLQESLSVIPRSTVYRLISAKEDYYLDEVGGSARLEVVTTYTGSEANNTRDYRASNSTEEIERSYLNFYANDFPAIEKSKPVRFEDDPINNVVTVFEEYHIPDFWTYDSAQNQYTGQTYARLLATYLYKPSTKVRTMPYDLRYPLNVSQTIKVHLPETWNVQDYNKAISADGFDFRTSWVYIDQIARLDFDLSTTRDYVEPARIQEYLRGIDKVNDELSFVLTYTPKNASSRFNFPLLLIVVLFGGVLFVGLKKMYDYDPESQFTAASYRNIGGWLVLPALGITLSPFIILYGLLAGDMDYFNYNQWRMLADPSYSNYNPPLGVFVIVEVLGNLALTGYGFVLLMLFWMKRTSVPRLAAIFYAVAFIFPMADALVGLYFNAPFDSQTTKDLIRALVSALIWIPYFRVSERVKGTFTVRVNKWSRS